MRLVMGRLVIATLAFMATLTLAKEISMFQQVRAIELTHEIIDDVDQIPKLVRLAFHACFGDGCNGCINLNDPNNAGLDKIVGLLNEKYEALKVEMEKARETTMSRADFWALAEVEAVRAATSNETVLVHKYGRNDCPSSPHSNAMHEYPNPRLGMEENLAKFGPGSLFNLPKDQVVALIGGGHSLGRVHTEFSGFGPSSGGSGPWDRSEYILDNDFFVVLTEMNWVQVQAPRGDFVWQAQSPPGASSSSSNSMMMPHHNNKMQHGMFMLNTDMALLNQVQVTNVTTGEVAGPCGEEYEDCPFDVVYAPISVAYAKDSNLFLSKFFAAYQTVVEAGSSNLVVASASLAMEPQPLSFFGLVMFVLLAGFCGGLCGATAIVSKYKHTAVYGEPSYVPVQEKEDAKLPTNL